MSQTAVEEAPTPSKQRDRNGDPYPDRMLCEHGTVVQRWAVTPGDDLPATTRRERDAVAIVRASYSLCGCCQSTQLNENLIEGACSGCRS